MWLILAQLAVAFVGGLIAAGVIVLVGGLGVAGALKTSITSLSAQVGDFEQRLTRQQKRDAANTAVEKRAETLSLKDEAQARLNEQPASATPARPSVLNFRRRYNGI